MNLKNYFSEKTGTGVLATSNSSGVVNTALYARPYVLDNGNVAFVMRDRLSHHNLQENGHAAYLFKENTTGGANGIRLQLKLTGEYTDHEVLNLPSRRTGGEYSDDEKRFLVTFEVAKCFNLVGGAVIETE